MFRTPRVHSVSQSMFRNTTVTQFEFKHVQKTGWHRLILKMFRTLQMTHSLSLNMFRTLKVTQFESKHVQNTEGELFQSKHAQNTESYTVRAWTCSQHLGLHIASLNMFRTPRAWSWMSLEDKGLNMNCTWTGIFRTLLAIYYSFIFLFCPAVVKRSLSAILCAILYRCKKVNMSQSYINMLLLFCLFLL